ncbi:MAG: ribosome biogenesis GTP-binding protein YihA/YsxC [Elusimicrobiota bacterium]
MRKLKKTTYYKTVTNHGEMGNCLAEVAFVGRSNVGKSSVLNALCGRRNLARISQKPGRTRTINIYAVEKDRWLIDLPGYGFALGPASEREGWQAMIEGYLLERESLKMVFMLVDAEIGPTKLDREMALWLQSESIPFCVVANKCDKVKRTNQNKQRKTVANELEVLPEAVRWVSAEKGLGIRELEQEVEKILELA